jgi:hypothetical protein
MSTTVTNILLTPKALAFKFLLQLYHLPTLLERPTPFEYLPVTNCPAPFLLQHAPSTPTTTFYLTSRADSFAIFGIIVGHHDGRRELF